MQALWTGSTVATLAAGSAAGQPVSGLRVSVSRSVLVRVSLAGGLFQAIPAGGQTMQVEFSTTRTGDDIVVDGIGALKLVASDGAWCLFSPAALASRRESVLVGNVRAYTYVFSSQAVVYSGATLNGIILTDGDGRILTDGSGVVLIRPNS